MSTVTILLLLLPHPSLLLVLTNYHLLTLHSTPLFLTHLTVLYTLTFLCFCSLIVCAARDPGPVPRPATKDAEEDGEGEMSITAALMGGPPEDDYSLPGRWCRICWAPKPERAHHCSECGRCVLKMGASVYIRLHAMGDAEREGCRSSLSMDRRQVRRV